MKKIALFLMVMFLVLSLSSCGVSKKAKGKVLESEQSRDLANEMENETYSNQTTYECVSKAIIKKSTGRIIIKPSQSRFKKTY